MNNKNKISISVYNSEYSNISKSVHDYIMFSIHDTVFKSVRNITSTTISSVISRTTYFSVRNYVTSFIQEKT